MFFFLIIISIIYFRKLNTNDVGWAMWDLARPAFLFSFPSLYFRKPNTIGLEYVHYRQGTCIHGQPSLL